MSYIELWCCTIKYCICWSSISHKNTGMTAALQQCLCCFVPVQTLNKTDRVLIILLLPCFKHCSRHTAYRQHYSYDTHSCFTLEDQVKICLSTHQIRTGQIMMSQKYWRIKAAILTWRLGQCLGFPMSRTEPND